MGKSDEEPMIIMSDLLQVSWRKLLCIQDFISKRQLITMECVSEVRDLMEMSSWMSVAYQFYELRND